VDNWCPTFRDNLVVLSSRVEISFFFDTSTLAYETKCRNVRHQLPSDAATHPRRREISSSHIFARLQRIIVLTLVPRNYDITLSRENNYLFLTLNSIPRSCNS
jgi:hypothetical protein